MLRKSILLQVYHSLDKLFSQADRLIWLPGSNKIRNYDKFLNHVISNEQLEIIKVTVTCN